MLFFILFCAFLLIPFATWVVWLTFTYQRDKSVEEARKNDENSEKSEKLSET